MTSITDLAVARLITGTGVHAARWVTRARLTIGVTVVTKSATSARRSPETTLAHTVPWVLWGKNQTASEQMLDAYGTYACMYTQHTHTHAHKSYTLTHK